MNELPAEIETAIDEFDYAVETYTKEGHSEFAAEVDQKRAALTAIILARLTAVEAERDKYLAELEYIDEAEQSGRF